MTNLQTVPENQKTYPVAAKFSYVRYKISGLTALFIKSAEEGKILTRKGERYRPGSIRTYKTLLYWLQRYEEQYDIVYLDEISADWAQLFVSFISQFNVSKNSVYTTISRLKSILHKACLSKLTQYSGYDIHISKEKTRKIYFTLPELRRIAEYDFGECEGKNYIRLLFLMNCLLGMRIGDFFRFLDDPGSFIQDINGVKIVKYTTAKTNIDCAAPVSEIASHVLNRYNYTFKKISKQHFNYYLKKILKEIGFTEKIKFYKTIGGIRTEVVKERYQMASSHTARRTFVSICEFADIPRNKIMSMTGHLTESSYKEYNCVLDVQNAYKVSEYEIFKIDLWSGKQG